MEDTTGLPIDQQVATHLRGIDQSLERIANAMQGDRATPGVRGLLQAISAAMTQMIAKRTI